MAVIYTQKVRDRLRSSSTPSVCCDSNAMGLASALDCGTYARISLTIDPKTKVIDDVEIRSNGCGFMLAAADVLAELLARKPLTELHGLNDDELFEEVYLKLDAFPSERVHCVAAVVDSVRSSFSEFRKTQLEEFAGEKAIICTCFAVTEEAIEKVINDENTHTIEDVGRAINAGTGCGSCQMMIQELIDSSRAEL